MSEQKKTKERFKKLSPTVFPFGFGVSKLEDDILIIDFVDKIPGDDETSYVITNSIAISRTKAEGLRDAIDDALNSSAES